MLRYCLALNDLFRACLILETRQPQGLAPEPSACTGGMARSGLWQARNAKIDVRTLFESNLMHHLEDLMQAEFHLQYLALMRSQGASRTGEVNVRSDSTQRPAVYEREIVLRCAVR